MQMIFFFFLYKKINDNNNKIMMFVVFYVWGKKNDVSLRFYLHVKVECSLSKSDWLKVRLDTRAEKT